MLEVVKRSRLLEDGITEVEYHAVLSSFVIHFANKYPLRGTVKGSAFEQHKNAFLDLRLHHSGGVQTVHSLVVDAQQLICKAKEGRQAVYDYLLEVATEQLRNSGDLDDIPF